MVVQMEYQKQYPDRLGCRRFFVYGHTWVNFAYPQPNLGEADISVGAWRRRGALMGRGRLVLMITETCVDILFGRSEEEAR